MKFEVTVLRYVTPCWLGAIFSPGDEGRYRLLPTKLYDVEHPNPNDFFLQLNFFRYDVAMNPPVISLGGYATVNRNLLLSVSDI